MPPDGEERCHTQHYCLTETAPQTAAASTLRLTRGQPIPVAGPTGYALVDLLRDAGFTIDQRRLDRVFHDQNGPLTGDVQVSVAPGEIRAVVRHHYNTVIRLQGQAVAACDCDCPDWLQSGGKAAGVPCKHILATAVDAPWPITSPSPAPVPAPVAPENEPTVPVAQPGPAAPDPDTLTFNQRVRRAIGQAVARLADLVEPILQTDRTPFLIGPTDVAKTSAIRLVAIRNGWAFEALDGMSSFADADLVGLRTDHGIYASVIARAFQRARGGECVLLFLDELTRLNQRAMDVLMRPLLAIAPEVAWAQRVPADDGQACAWSRCRCGASTGRRSAAARWRWPATRGVRRSIPPSSGAPCRSRWASTRPSRRSSRSRRATPSRRRGSW